jgi:hypothetical protein
LLLKYLQKRYKKLDFSRQGWYYIGYLAKWRNLAGICNCLWEISVDKAVRQTMSKSILVSGIVGIFISICLSSSVLADLTDLNNDGIIDFNDFAIFANDWGHQTVCGENFDLGDFNNDRVVNYLDFMFFVDDWLMSGAIVPIINVSSISALQSAINSASAGDVIVLADGTYTNANITVGTDGITVKAATPGGVIFNGSSTCSITGNNNTFSGFQYKDGNCVDGTGNVFELDGNYNTLTQCNFYEIGGLDLKYINFMDGKHHNVMSYCNIEAKPYNGTPNDFKLNNNCAVQVSVTPTIGYNTIRYCTFMNFQGDQTGDVGCEPIRIGLGADQDYNSVTVVEYCYFENLGHGDSETISMKSQGNVVRYNTFNNNPLAQVVCRTGDKNRIYGNFFINSGGIRVKEGKHYMIYNNYFQGAGNIDFGSIELMQYTGTEPNRVSDVYLYHNTFYNPGVIDLGGGSSTKSPLNIRFANNIFYKTGTSAILTNPGSNGNYLGNIFWGGAPLGRAYNSTEFRNVDPNLTLNSYSYYVLSSLSTNAIDSSNGTYTPIEDNPYVDVDPNLMLDIERQARPADKTLKDVGCDEYTTGAITNRRMTSCDAGPSYISR